MSTWLKTTAELILKPESLPLVRETLAQMRDDFEGRHAVQVSGTTVSIDFDNGIGWGSCERIREAYDELAPHLAEPCAVEWENEGDSETFWIAPEPGQVRTAEVEGTIAESLEALRRILPQRDLDALEVGILERVNRANGPEAESGER